VKIVNVIRQRQLPYRCTDEADIKIARFPSVYLLPALPESSKEEGELVAVKTPGGVVEYLKCSSVATSDSAGRALRQPRRLACAHCLQTAKQLLGVACGCLHLSAARIGEVGLAPR